MGCFAFIMFLLSFGYECSVSLVMSVLYLFLVVSGVGLWSVIMAFPRHMHLCFFSSDK